MLSCLQKRARMCKISVLGVFGACKESCNLDEAKYPAAVAASHALLHCGCLWGKGKSLRGVAEGAQVYGDMGILGAGGGQPSHQSSLRHSPAS